MTKISILLGVSGITLISACAPLTVDQMPPRSPSEFLQDIKVVADSDSLTNVSAVARRLRINLVPGPKKSVYDNDGYTFLGHSVDVEERGMTREYTSDNFHYGMFNPENRNFDRVSISLSVNSETLCVTPVDLKQVFGKVVRYVSPHTSSLGYSYENLKRENIRAYFNFEQYGCLYKFGFFENREME